MRSSWVIPLGLISTISVPLEKRQREVAHRHTDAQKGRSHEVGPEAERRISIPGSRMSRASSSYDGSMDQNLPQNHENINSYCSEPPELW